MAKRYHAAGQLDQAEAGYADVLKRNRKSTDALIGLALVRLLRGDRRTAIGHFKKAVRLAPQNAIAHFLLGSALVDDGVYEEAIQHYRQCVRLDPDNRKYLRRLGDMWTFVDQYSEAAACYERLIEAEPDNADVYNNLGMMYLKVNLFDEAVAALRRAVELDPSDLASRSNLLLSLNYLPMASRESIFAEHKKIGRSFGVPPASAVAMKVPEAATDRRLRIGFVSPDFRNHSVAYFLEPLFVELDRTAFEIFCYAAVKQPDEVTAHFRSLSDHWHSTLGKSDDAVVAKIRSDGIDILVDLAGHTGGQRLPVFARRAAPVQANWLGYGDTTGLAAMDFRITDAVCDPEGEADALATETLIRVPKGFLCYRPPPDAPDVVEPPCVAAGFPTFGSFNNPSKINERVIALWSEVMRHAPESRFVLKYGGLQDTVVRDRITGWFGDNGIERKRLTFLGRTESQVEHLGLYGKIDIALDTYPYNGATTTCEALWMGVPVVSLAGDRHVSRLTASLLGQAGLEDLIATDPDDYVAIACELAGDRDRLIRLRHGLRDRMRTSSLMDEAGFARRMEAAFRQMVQLKLPAPAAE